jgi:hypothetical protein
VAHSPPQWKFAHAKDHTLRDPPWIFKVDLRSGELSRNGLKIKLPEQSSQILAMLLRREGEVITREKSVVNWLEFSGTGTAGNVNVAGRSNSSGASCRISRKS